MQEQITFYCRNCKKSLKIAYNLTGREDAPVMPSIQIKCHHCKRVMVLKHFTYKNLTYGVTEIKYYI